MRTVTFSTPQIRNTIANHFVPLNSNIEGDPLAGESIGHAPNEPPGDCIRGNGRQNVQTIFMTPNEEIFHVATGFLSPQDMMTEMEFAKELFDSLNTEDENRHDLVRKAHQDVLTNLGSQNTQKFADEPMAEAMRGMINFGQNGQMPTSGMGNPFQQLSNQLMTQDQRFMVKRPLIQRTDFERDPGDLVGRGKTFFSSSKSSGQGFPGR
ncbi:MAG: hypothetical protein GY819_10090 [Planctomycetaceae bacterium]|nr:hypothetical protein [Planctomycetaceae bacterium]MCP4463131.1 hypothetical protein [Planctomycetaceae bacterium]